jgi:ABC-type Fe3+-hydroxamate transport system substrate-binding protein
VAQRLEGAQPEILDVAGGVPLERMAALEPDLILATNLEGVDEIRDELSRIAPTVTYLKDYRPLWTRSGDELRAGGSGTSA